MPGHLTIVTEDLPSEIVTEILLSHVDPHGVVVNRLGRQGNGYIRRKLKDFNEAAAGLKIFVLTDRDSVLNCPIELRQEWIRGPQAPNLVVRFAEMETEAWLLADPDRVTEFLEIPGNRVPNNVDRLPDPKQTFVNLARSSRNSRIRDDMVPAQGASAAVGPAYNPRVEEFLRTKWRVGVAIENSPSLKRAATRLRELMHRE